MSESAEQLAVNVLVLGAGPGGYVAAIRAAQLGQTVAIVEREYWGGVCLNVGCIPTKVLLRHAEVAALVSRHAKAFGLPDGVTADFRAAHERSRSVAEGRIKGVHYLMKKNGIRQFAGTGTFTSDTSLTVTTADGPIADITFDHAIIATGSEIRNLPGVDLGARVTGYIEVVLSETMPDSLVVIGAGPIGIEFACVAASFGSNVTVLEYQDRILPAEDVDVSAELAKALKKLGVTVVTGARVVSASDTESGAHVTYDTAAGETTEIDTDHVLVAVGFSPRLEGYGLDATGVAVTDSGAIDVDAQLRTSVPHIFAIGDVTGKLALAHVAEAQGIVAAEVIGAASTRVMGDYRDMPRAVYSSPQVASFGLTEAQAREELGDVLVASFPFVANGKAHAVGETAGFVKLIANPTTRTLVGGHLVGPDVSELLPELTLAAGTGTTIDDLIHNVHAHPTLSESLQEAFHGLAGHVINF
ncbi:MAG: dihydrolipoyl dehydrogenase [Microbacteriaceae bacterium]|nr:dihydrolipoyl dehydrogenase [Microbacteriaceae bacterium]